MENNAVFPGLNKTHKALSSSAVADLAGLKKPRLLRKII